MTSEQVVSGVTGTSVVDPSANTRTIICKKRDAEPSLDFDGKGERGGRRFRKFCPKVGKSMTTVDRVGGEGNRVLREI